MQEKEATPEAWAGHSMEAEDRPRALGTAQLSADPERPSEATGSTTAVPTATGLAEAPHLLLFPGPAARGASSSDPVARGTASLQPAHAGGQDPVRVRVPPGRLEGHLGEGGGRGLLSAGLGQARGRHGVGSGQALAFVALAVLLGGTFSFWDGRSTGDLPLRSGGADRKPQLSARLSAAAFSSPGSSRLILQRRAAVSEAPPPAGTAQGLGPRAGRAFSHREEPGSPRTVGRGGGQSGA